jgi:hypothetical protein
MELSAPADSSVERKQRWSEGDGVGGGRRPPGSVVVGVDSLEGAGVRPCWGRVRR